MAIISKAPLRISFAGGGTDLEPFCRDHGGCVLSATINQYAYVSIEPNASLEEDTWIFHAPDMQQEHIVKGPIESWDTSKATLLINTYKYMYKHYGFEPLPVKLIGYCEAPPGSGLGSSSAFTVSTVSAINEYYHLAMTKYDIASMSHYIEREVCGLPGGKQDQYSSTFGGFNFIEFNKSNLVNPIEIGTSIKETLEMSTILYYIGQPRADSKIIEHNMKNLEQDVNTIKSTKKLKENCLKFKMAIIRGDYKGIKKLMNEQWHLKKSLSSGIISSDIDRIYQYAISNGAEAGKICGAGGGGHLVFFTDFTKRHQLVSALKNIQGNVVPFSFVKFGVKTWNQ